MRRFLFITMPVLLFGCCAGIEKGTNTYFRSYVMSYYDIDEISLITSFASKEIVILTKPGACVGNYKSQGQEKEIYDDLCERHNDITYNRVVKMFTTSPNIEYACVDFISMDITSDFPYDDDHPANSSLANIVIFNSFSAQPYIDSGYVMYDWGEGGESESRIGERPYCPINKLVSQLTLDDMTLLGDGRLYLGSLLLQSLPTLAKTHTFTVTMTTDDERVFEASIEMTFE